ncbi:AbiH family protein [Atopobium sp. oral taxon 810]|uniref:AbiH family protein n=1 Tax=Atopobium sp. oral taxon 810 TaxID=712158 RepID=UPI000396120B|nr:AbiH family protein [Atopobium sp. oral taxon 810]ERI05132.1 hypothetical protein HMPREF9069_01054 [Atopobium sp. oral taxon 810 str. F0209]
MVPETPSSEISNNEVPSKTIRIDGQSKDADVNLIKTVGTIDMGGVKSALDSGAPKTLISSGLQAAINSGAFAKATNNMSGIASSFNTGALKAASEAISGTYGDIGKRFSSILDDAKIKGLDIDSITPKLAAAKYSIPDYSIPDLNYQVAGYTTYWQQLIIIGNGFDLQCGLRSKFGDFFKPRFDRIELVTDYKAETWSKLVEESDLTLWDFILEANIDSPWCDIEGAVERWVLSASASKDKDSPFSKAVEHVKVQPFMDGTYTLVNGRLKSEQDDENHMLGNLARYVWTVDRSVTSDGYSRDKFMTLLRVDLLRLEQAFAKYLAEEIASNDGYVGRCKRLYEMLERDGKKTGDDYETSTSVLSFNYTEQMKSYFDGGEDGAFVNIHGKLGGQIIFGIDGKDCMDNPDAVSFTKTYRLMQIGGSRTDKLINTANSSNLQNATDVIKFYGHSLGKADYSYFQSIFDGVDLYESKTVLVFYYPYSAKEGAEANNECWRTDITNKVNDLLVAYGKTMDNQDHGKNLMHKLLLEGRLLIRGVQLD